MIFVLTHCNHARTVSDLVHVVYSLELSSGSAVFGVLYCEEFLVNHFIVNCCCLCFGIHPTFNSDSQHSVG